MNPVSRFHTATAKFVFLALCLFNFSTVSFGQKNDSLDIQLFSHDDINFDNGKDKRRVTSTNRLADSPEDMAQEVIIIEGDEIRKFGYSTLVDVLKSIPGFRTSQPGNAEEGETFLMRGLYGNDHAKILINGIPIKPEAVRGMPIASQLPIRHAERIEIVLGPSSSSYGSDAMAGVINIVLPEIDRPVFAWADVNLLTPKITEFNLTLGGKVGKGKNILNYEIFASSSRASNLNILIPDDSIKAEGITMWQDQLLFADIEGGDTIPEVDDLQRESRLLGAYLKFRWFEISAMNMYRNVHSGIGSHPLIQSYHDPGLSIGENINSFSLKYNDVNDKRYMSKFAVSALTYRTLTNSSYYGVAHYLSNGKNFIYARSVDFSAEYSGVLKISPQMRMAIGVTADQSISHPFTSYLQRPYRDETTSFDLPSNSNWLSTGVNNPSMAIDSTSQLDTAQYLNRYTRSNYGGFIHFSYRTKSGKFAFEAGTRVDYTQNNKGFSDLVFTPKAGFVYRPVERFKIRGYYGTGYRAPRSYYLYNNYYETYGAWQNGAGLKRFSADSVNILAEELDGGELAIEWIPRDDLRLNLGYFIHYMENKVMRQENRAPPANSGLPPLHPHDLVGNGYTTDESYSVLNSIMLTVQYKKKFSKVDLDFLVSYQYAYGWEEVEEDDDVPEGVVVKTPGYRYMPDHSIKGNFTVSAYDFTLSLRNGFMGNFVTDIFRRNRKIESTESNRNFYNLDILLHKQLFRQLSIFGGVYNVLNSVQSGISNVSISSTWGFNPQYGRTYKLGLTFKLN